MKDIDKNTELIINNDINIEPQPYNFIRVSRHGISLKFNENILSIIKQFYRPNTIQNAVDNIGSDSSGVQEWIDLTSFIFMYIDSLSGPRVFVWASILIILFLLTACPSLL